jgi:hypothetical protein
LAGDASRAWRVDSRVFEDQEWEPEGSARPGWGMDWRDLKEADLG